MMESAIEAIDFLRLPDRSQVDLILMDIMMPEIDGIEAIRIIKRNESLQDIPIVMVSAQDDEEKIQEAFNAGAIDYINKPIKKLELHARVRSILKLKEEMDRRKAREKELTDTVGKLRKAIAEVKHLTGLLPICAHCKKVRDDTGYWQQVEHYVMERADVRFSHGICPDCVRELYPDIADKVLNKLNEKKK
jgi:CheY-like chemotaxis protein